MVKRPSRLVSTLLLPLMALALGCASPRPAVPAWITGTSSQHPSDQYLIGVGEGSTASVAAERAYGAVARIFRAEVTAQSRDWESMLLVEGRGGQRTERRLSLEQLTQVSTDKVLENVAVLDSWRNPATGQYHALAGLSRTQTEQALLERLRALDEAVAGHLDEAGRAATPLARIRALHRAVREGVLREAYNADLRVVRTSGQGLASPHQLVALGAELDRLRTTHLVTAVEVTGEQAGALQQAIVESLVREGHPVTSEADSAVTLLVKGAVQLWDAQLQDAQFEYVRWCGDFQIVETPTGRVLGAVSRSGREGHVTAREARTRAVRVMQQELSRELTKTLTEALYGDGESRSPASPAACPAAPHAS